MKGPFKVDIQNLPPDNMNRYFKMSSSLLDNLTRTIPHRTELSDIYGFTMKIILSTQQQNNVSDGILESTQ